VHDPNDLYDTTFRLFTLQSPFLMGKTQRAIALLSNQRFVDLNANLRYFEQRYDTILAQHDEQRDSMASVRGTRFRRVQSLYYDYIRLQSAEVQSMLKRIAAIADTSGE
jgi:negative regulator of sigma E activity